MDDMSMLVARGIGKDAALYHSREGIRVKRVLAKGQLPFKVNQSWTVTRQNEQSDLLIFDLLDVSITVVYEIDMETGTFTQIPHSSS